MPISADPTKPRRIVRSVSLYPHEHAALRWLAAHQNANLSEMMRRLIADEMVRRTTGDWWQYVVAESEQ